MSEFDGKDAEILAERIAEWGKIAGPRVGDFCELADGTVRRFTHDWGDSLQTTCGTGHPCAGDVSFYFGKGYMSFSGSLDSSIPKEQFSSVNEMREGSAWFFHHDWAKAHNGVYFKVPCRVYRQVVQRAEQVPA